MDVAEIIKRAGGARAIAEALGNKPTAWAVQKWTKNGIPSRYWPTVMERANVSSDQMLAANQSAERAAQQEPAA